MLPQAISATICSASFLERPVPPSKTRSPTCTDAVNVLSWSGPVPSSTYCGTPRSWLAEISCSEVFQSRPAPSSAATAMTGSKIAWMTSADRAMPNCT